MRKYWVRKEKCNTKEEIIEEIFSNPKGSLKVIDTDTVQFRDKYAYTSDRYKFGRTYEVVSRADIEDDIYDDEVFVEEYKFSELENKRGYYISGCSHSQGYTTDFFIRIDNMIYICSYVDFKYGMLDISIAYNIDKDCFEMDAKEYPIIPDDIETFIREYVRANY